MGEERSWSEQNSRRKQRSRDDVNWAESSRAGSKTKQKVQG